MAEPLANWDRPYFEPGAGEPFLFYVIYGKVQVEAALSRSRYRSNGIADGLVVAKYRRDEHPDVFSGFESGYLWDQLSINNAALAADITNSPECIILQGTPQDQASLNYLRDTVGMLTFFSEHGGVAIFDPQMFEWWSAEKWRAIIFDSDSPSPNSHVMILYSEEGAETGGIWFHTRGMRKFGRPDISIRGVHPDQRQGAIDLCQRLINMQALGAIVPDGQEIQMKSLPPGCIVRHGGHLDDPDFNNVHIEIIWPKG